MSQEMGIRGGARRGAIKILFAGGCHVAGFPVGREHGFPEVAARLLRAAGWDVEPETVSHVPLHRPEKVTGALQRVQPDVLVLQVGHFELVPPGLVDVLLGLFGMRRRKKKGEGANSSPEARGIPESGSAVGLRIKSWLRAPLASGLVHAGLRQRGCREKLGPFCDEVAKAWGGPCLLLSPLPGANPTVSLMRRVCLPDYEFQCSKHGWLWLDLFRTAPVWDGRRLGLAEWHADGFHLGRQVLLGHK